MFEIPLPHPAPKKFRRMDRVRAAAENAFFDYPANQSLDGVWAALWNSKKGKFPQVEALFTLLRSVVPDSIFERLTGDRYKYQSDVLPVDPNHYVFDEKKVGKGSESVVYKLLSTRSDFPSLVIKIDQSGVQNTDALVKRATAIQDEYEEERGWYSSIPGFIPEEYRFIAKSPRGGKPALFTIQEFFGTADSIRDIFQMNREDLIEIINSDEELRKSFLTFVDLTLTHAKEEDAMIDTAGEKNIVLVKRKEGIRLVLLDPHSIKHSNGNMKEGKRLQKDVDYLRMIRDEVIARKD